MELVQQSVQISVTEQPTIHQFRVEEDVNVPDAKEDVMQILQSYGKIYIKEVQKMEQYLQVKGHLEYQILYATEGDDKRISCMEGVIAMEELVYIDGGISELYQVRCNQVDMQTARIHSRKINVNALVEWEVRKTGVKEERITVDVELDEMNEKVEEKCSNIRRKYKAIPILEFDSYKQDTYRIKEEVKLTGTKENIGSILMSRIGSLKLDSRAGRDEISFHGEMEIFSMYVSDEWKEDYVVQSVSFDGSIEYHGIEEGVFYSLNHQVEGLSIESKMDEDGELRVLQIEATLKMDVRVFEEKEYDILEDMYMLEKQCEIEREPIYLESLLLQNQSKCKIVEVLSLPELKDELLQVCTVNGRVQVESTSVSEDKRGIEIEGILHVDVLYIKGDDRCPYASWQGMIPFSHVIECLMEDEISYDIESYLEQVSVTMAGNGEMEIKAALNFHSFIREQQIIDGITGIEAKKFTKEELENQAGIIGYFYKEEDEMWDIAKRFHTTIEGILKNNKIDEKDIKAGQKLLIFKENVSIL